MAYDVLIVGGGHAGAQAAIALRAGKFAGTVAIVSDELDHPYERPPLSKDYLSGGRPLARMLLRPLEFWGDQRVQVLLGRRISSVDPALHTVTTESGEELGYGVLVWAAGGTPRRLSCPGGEFTAVHTIRRRTDVDRIRATLDTTQDLVVVGGGFIGLEAAAELVKLGKRVTVLEALDRVLARVVGEPLSRFYENEHRSRGVDVRLGVRIDSILAVDSQVNGVKLHDGSVVPAQLVIAGIGIVPATQPLLAAGAIGVNGITVDAQCRTNLPDVYAIGDCAAQETPFADGASVRLESIQNANDHAKVVAHAILGLPATACVAPWFWSNQFDIKLQTIGLSQGHDATVLRGDPQKRRFSVVYLKAGRVVALDCVNSPADFMQGRALVTARAHIEPELLADTTRPLKDLLPRG